MNEPLHVAILKALLEKDGELALFIATKPGSKREGFELGADGQLLVRVRARAQEGQANDRVIELLSEALKCPKRDIRLMRGAAARHKELRIKKVDRLLAAAVLTKMLET